VPTGSINDKHRNSVLADASTDLRQVHVHGVDIDSRQNQTASHAAGRADGTEQVDPGESPVAQCPRACAAPRPDAR
jgi:hypothetical protein